MKFTRKIVPALALLIVSAVLMTTATFAWFSMNTRVTATGMQMGTEAGDNVLIANNTSKTKETALGNFKNTLVLPVAKANLRPVSSVDGANFYFVDAFQVAGNGAAVAPSGYNPYTKYDTSDAEKLAASQTAFENNYRKAGIKPYVEYAFQVMATKAEGAAADLVIDSIALTYNGSTNVQKAFRVAVFADEFTGTEVTTETLVTILSQSGAANHTPNSAVSGVNATSAVQKPGAATKIATAIPEGETHFYRVVVRVWLEGEDTTCTNATFADLDDTWSLDLGISFADGSHSAQTTLSSTVRNVVLPAGYTIGTTPVAVDAALYYPIMNGDAMVAVEGMTNTYLFTTTASGAVTAATDFYALTEETYNGYKTYHYPINVTPQYSVKPAIDLAAAVVDDTTPVDVGGENYYAITGKTLDGKQLYAKVTTLAADSVIYTIEGGAATDVTVYCTLPAGTP